VVNGTFWEEFVMPAYLQTCLWMYKETNGNYKLKLMRVRLRDLVLCVDSHQLKVVRHNLKVLCCSHISKTLT